MANCGCSRCECQIIAGPGVALAGNGSTAAPYVIGATAPPVDCDQVRPCLSAGPGATYDPATGVIGADISADAGNQMVLGSDDGLYVPAGGAASTALAVTDTPTVDLELTGDGSAGDPYTLSAQAVLDPAPPGGGANLLQAGADGLYVECDQVRTCLTAGPGVDYDPATGTISATGGEPTALAVTDSPTVDLGLTGTGQTADPYTLTAGVNLDPAPPGGANLIQEGTGGLYVDCPAVRGCIAAGDGIDYDPATGVIEAQLSGDAGNTLAIGSDGGLMAPPGAGGTVEVANSPCIGLTGTGAAGDPIVATPALDPDPGNQLQCGPNGLLVPAPPAGGTVVTGQDGATIDVEVTGDGSAGNPYVVTAEAILEPAPPGGGDNLLNQGPGGLYVECADIRGCLSAGDGAAYDPATGVISARPSGDAGNTLAIGTDGGLLVPPGAGGTVEAGCGLTGDGTAAAPLAAAVEEWPYPACDADSNAGFVYCDSTGALRSEPLVYARYTQDHVNTQYAPTVVPSGFDNVIETRMLAITNPDPCREAFVICEVEVDVDFDLPAGSGAAYGITTDEMYYVANTGSTAVRDAHVQTTKVYNRTIAPGATLNEPLDVTMGRGAGGATYNRIQSFMRAFIFVLQV